MVTKFQTIITPKEKKHQRELRKQVVVCGPLSEIHLPPSVSFCLPLASSSSSFIMSAAAKTASELFPKIYSSLGLGKNTTSQLQAFRKRNEDARRELKTLQDQKTDVDFSHYKSILKVRI